MKDFFELYELLSLKNAQIAMDKLSKNLDDYKDTIVSTNEITRKAKFTPDPNTYSKALAAKTKTGRISAAIHIKRNQFKGILISKLLTPDITKAEISGGNECFILISAYLPADENSKATFSGLANTINKIEPNKKIIVSSDTNSRSSLWNDEEINQRG